MSARFRCSVCGTPFCPTWHRTGQSGPECKPPLARPRRKGRLVINLLFWALMSIVIALLVASVFWGRA